MKTTRREYAALKALLPLTEKDFRFFIRLWERSKALEVDSRLVERDYLFIAQKGILNDGHTFIPGVLRRGAAALADPSYPQQPPSQEKKIIRIPDLADWTGKLSALFYHHPSEKMRVVGITGTDGKTSTTRLLAEAYHSWGYQTAAIGTTGVYMIENPELIIPHQNTPNTTPDPVILQRILYSLLNKKISVVVMEVSSHGLTLGRIQEIAFDSGIWTNLGPEHLDFHSNLENYARTKSRLFEMLRHSPKENKYGLVGLDSFLELYAQMENQPWIREIMARIDTHPYPISFFHQNKSPWLKFLKKIMPPEQIKDSVTTYTGVSGKSSHSFAQKVIIDTSKNIGNRKQTIFTSLIGQFNAQNLTAAFLEGEHFRSSQSHRLRLSLMKKSWRKITIKGRMEEFPLNSSCHSRRKILKECRLYIDYAHTPQALGKVISSLRSVWKKRTLLCVFGCGGDRDTKKRRPMGSTACQLADISIITDDNPRTEDPGLIRETIEKGWQEQYHKITVSEQIKKSIEIIPDRRKAIQRALEIIPPKGIILLSGKGHEDYQIIGKNKFPFDERVVLKDLLSNNNLPPID